MFVQDGFLYLIVTRHKLTVQCPAFMGELSPVLYRLLVPACHASKWANLQRRPNLWRPPEISLISVKPQQSLFLLIGVLSENQKKNTNDHYHCPISVFILTTSKLEAVLENYRCSLKLSKDSVPGGGGLSSAPPSTCLVSRYSGQPQATKYVHIKSTTVYAPRRNWDSPQPPTRRLVCPLPPVSGGRGTVAGEKGVGRVPIPTRGIHCGTLQYVRTLCLRLCAHGGTLSLFYQCLFLPLHLSLSRSKLDGGR